jgi:hypothetical protein
MSIPPGAKPQTDNLQPLIIPPLKQVDFTGHFTKCKRAATAALLPFGAVALTYIRKEVCHSAGFTYTTTHWQHLLSLGNGYRDEVGGDQLHWFIMTCWNIYVNRTRGDTLISFNPEGLNLCSDRWFDFIIRKT